MVNYIEDEYRFNCIKFSQDVFTSVTIKRIVSLQKTQASAFFVSLVKKGIELPQANFGKHSHMNVGRLFAFHGQPI